MKKYCFDVISRATTTIFLFFILATMSAIASPIISAASAAEVTLAWDASSGNSLAGYNLYYKTGTSGAPYDGTGLNEGDSPVNINLGDLSDTGAPVFTLTGLEEGTEYFFTVTVFDTDGVESDFSNSVSYTVASTGDTSDSDQDTTDSDSSDTDSETDIDTDQTVPGTPGAVSESVELDTLAPAYLALGPFSGAGTGGTHAETEWQVFRSDDDLCVFSSVSGTSLTTLTVPEIILDENTTYYWMARFIDSDGLVSEWSDAAWFTTGASLTDADGDGVHDDQKVDDTVDLNQDGIPDAEQEIIKSIVLPSTNQPIGLDIEASETITAILYLEAVDTESMSVPDNVKLRVRKMPTGLINYKLAVAEPGDTAVLTVRFAEAVDPDSKWMKLDVITGTWTDYSGYCQLSDDRMSMTVELVDGGYGDDDGIANGIIVDPAGLEMAASGDEADTDTDTETASDDSGSGGGCFITGTVEDGGAGANTTTAGILLMILLLGAILVPARERMRKK